MPRHDRPGITKLRLQRGWSERLAHCMSDQACRKERMLARRNYQYEKRQKDLARKKKQDKKRLRKQNRKEGDTDLNPELLEPLTGPPPPPDDSPAAPEESPESPEKTAAEPKPES